MIQNLLLLTGAPFSFVHEAENDVLSYIVVIIISWKRAQKRRLMYFKKITSLKKALRKSQSKGGSLIDHCSLFMLLLKKLDRQSQ